MMRRAKIIICLIVLAMLVTGCISGTGFGKSATLMPDEFSISKKVIQDNGENWYSDGGVTFGVKWKLK